MKTILITGYKSHELGIFQAKDPRLQVIKAAIRRDLLAYLDEGVSWLIFTGQLGFESWVLEVAQSLRADYDLQLGCIFLFENQGENWNASNQAQLAAFKQLDFVKYAYPAYQHPGQFKNYNQFLADNTDGAYVFYDPEQETQLKYLYEVLKAQADYALRTLTFDDLNEIAQNFEEN